MLRNLASVEGVESLVCIAKERKLHLRTLLLDMTSGLRSLEKRRGLCLRNLVNREVSSIGVGLESWLEWCTDTTKSVEVDAMEERVVLDLVSATTSKAVLRVADETADKVLGLGSKLNIVWEVESAAPVDDLAVGVVLVLGTERWPPDLALEHNRTQRPPIAVERVTVAGEDLWCDVIWSSDGRIGHDTSGLTPIVDDGSVANSQVDLV